MLTKYVRHYRHVLVTMSDEIAGLGHVEQHQRAEVECGCSPSIFMLRDVRRNEARQRVSVGRTPPSAAAVPSTPFDSCRGRRSRTPPRYAARTAPRESHTPERAPTPPAVLHRAPGAPPPAPQEDRSPRASSTTKSQFHPKRCCSLSLSGLPPDGLYPCSAMSATVR